VPHEIASCLGCVIAPVGLALAQERKMVKSDELTWNDHPVFTFTRGIPGRASLVAASIDDISLTFGAIISNADDWRPIVIFHWHISRSLWGHRDVKTPFYL
jgi:hypothetical protein